MDFALVIILLWLWPRVFGNKILPAFVIDNKMNVPFCKGKLLNFAFDNLHINVHNISNLNMLAIQLSISCYYQQLNTTDKAADLSMS